MVIMKHQASNTGNVWGILNAKSSLKTLQKKFIRYFGLAFVRKHALIWKVGFQYAKRNSKVCNQQKQNWFVFKSMTYEMRLILNLRSLMMRKRPVRRKISNSFRDHQLKERFCLEKNLFCSKWRCHSLMMIRSHMSRLSTVSWGFSTIWTILLS